MQNKILFSIIIPVYNRANFIERTINSVLEQSYNNFEMILVDDGSTDNSGEVINSINDERIKYYRIDNSERAFARNYGFNRSNGDYITFLDSDDIIYPDHLQNALTCIIDLNFTKILTCSYNKIDANDNILSTVIAENKNLLSTMSVYGNPIIVSSIFIKREIFNEDQFNEDRSLSGSEDFELWLRLACKYEFDFSTKITAAITLHDERSVLTNNIPKLILQKELFLQYTLNTLQKHEKNNNFKRRLKSSSYSYISLHCSLAKNNKKTAVVYLIKAFFKDPTIILRKRFYAIIKHLVF